MTFEELERTVLDRLAIGEAPWHVVAMVRGLLNREYLRLAAEEDLSSTRATLALTAGDPLVTLPNDFVKVVSMRRGATRMFLVTADEFVEHEAAWVAAGGDADGPWCYAFEGPNRLRVFPTPSASDPAGIVLYYVQRPAPMVSATDSPVALPVEWHDVLAERVLMRVAGSLGKPDVVADAQAAVSILESSIRRVNADREGGNYRIPLPGYGIR